MARSVPDSAWIPALANVGVAVADPTTFVDTFSSMTDEKAIRTIVRLVLTEQVPDIFDRPVAALTQANAAWEKALNDELDADRIEFWSWVLKIKPVAESE